MGGASADAIRHHYDAGNRFYRLWLDGGLTYSCALFEAPGISLEEAQVAKLEYHIREAGVRPGACVLDVGCGWGSLLRRLVGHHGVARAVGLTLSDAQADWIKKHDMPSRAEVLVESWRDHEPPEPYDAIVSIGAFEHFASCGQSDEAKIEGYASFFRWCRGVLNPGGCVSLQTIAHGTRPLELSQDLRDLKFVAREIFPESLLPSLSEIAAAVVGAFEVVRLQNDRRDYARTLREWLARLTAQRDQALALVGPEQVGRYERYLACCARLFAEGKWDLLRLTLRRLDG